MHSSIMSSGIANTRLAHTDEEAVDDGQRQRQAHGDGGAHAFFAVS
jgi:hypothetical protein